MYIVNGQCLLSGTLELAESAAAYQISTQTVPGFSYIGLLDISLDHYTAAYSSGTDTLELTTIFLHASDHQCAFPGPFVWLPPLVPDVLFGAFLTVVISYALIKVIKGA